MKRVYTILLLIGTLQGVDAEDITAIVPSYTLTNASALAYPFFISTNQTARFQQVYLGNAFRSWGVPTNGLWVTKLSFGDRGIHPFYGTRDFQYEGIEIRMSTTAAQPSALSPAFANNIGPDETVVFGPGTLVFRPRPPEIRPGIGFGSTIVLDRPFFYRWPSGNLLLDIRNSHGIPLENASSWLSFEAWGAQPYSSCMYARNVNATHAETLDSYALETFFLGWSAPPLRAKYESNAVVVAYPYLTVPARLQWADNLGPSVAWSDYDGPIEVTSTNSTARIPLNSLAAKRFFRLSVTTPQSPVPAPSTDATGPNLSPNR